MSLSSKDRGLLKYLKWILGSVFSNILAVKDEKKHIFDQFQKQNIMAIKEKFSFFECPNI